VIKIGIFEKLSLIFRDDLGEDGPGTQYCDFDHTTKEEPHGDIGDCEKCKGFPDESDESD
jgi:hypothetical protein